MRNPVSVYSQIPYRDGPLYLARDLIKLVMSSKTSPGSWELTLFSSAARLILFFFFFCFLFLSPPLFFSRKRKTALFIIIHCWHGNTVLCY